MGCSVELINLSQMERIIKLAASLPDGSETRNAITGILVKGLWDSLQHPPLSYLGDEYVYRTADGSNNVSFKFNILTGY